MNLEDIGWENYLRKTSGEQAGSQAIARVAIQNKFNFWMYSENGELEGIIRGKLRQSPPKVGDWVKISALPGENKAVIEEILPRYSVIARQEAGEKTEPQVIVSNVDLVFVTQSLDHNFNLARLERYLIMIQDGGALPIIVLNKADLSSEADQRLAEVKKAHPDIHALAISVKTSEGMEQIRNLIKAGQTVAFVGSSGVGKSTIVNALAGQELFLTQEVRQSDSKGRHTTTRRQMALLPQGGILIDTPGMRELGLNAESESLAKTFADLEELSWQCKFSDCDHVTNPGCAVLSELEKGNIDRDRYLRYLKLKKELGDY